MDDEIPSEITVDGAEDGTLRDTFNFEAGASAEFHKGKDNQIDDAAGENALMWHIALRPICLLSSLQRNIREPVFRPDVLRTAKTFQL
jgi:hypothetical protein